MIGRYTYRCLCVRAGMIHAKDVLDRETQSYYWLTVYAHDSASVPRSSFVDVLIDVDDVNDNRPQTAQPVYRPSVPEGSRDGSRVIHLDAFDHDDIANGGLTYDITSGNPQGFFAIDRVTGALSLSSVATVASTAHVHDLLVLINYVLRNTGGGLRKVYTYKVYVDLYSASS